ncbi:glycosyltransferase [Bacillus cereus]
MKITYIIHSLQFAGAERLVLDLIDRLKDKHDISVISIYKTRDIEGYKKIQKTLESNDIKHICLDKEIGTSKWKTLTSLNRAVKLIGPDLIHAHTFIPNVYSGLRNIFFNKIVTISTLHSGGDDWFRKKDLFLEKFSLKGINRVVAVSEHVRDFYIKKIKLEDKNKVVTIENGILTDRFYQLSTEAIRKKRKEIGIQESDSILINVARLVPVKSQDFLINIMKMLDSKYKLLLVGNLEDETYVKLIQEQIKRNNLGDRIKLLGSREDVNELIQISDVFLFPSKYEASGIALMEAMYCQKKIIGSSIPSNREFQSYYSELEVLDREEIMWKESILQATKSREIPSVFKASEFYFSLDRVTKNYENLYLEMYSEERDR